MKSSKNLIALSIVLLLAFQLQAQTRIKLREAIKKGMVKLHVRGTGHTGKCVTANITNEMGIPITLDVEAGQKLLCSDTTVQDLVISRSELITLKPKETHKHTFYAFCIEMRNGGPSNNTYRIGEMAKGALLKVVQFIAKNGLQDALGQNVVWCVTDNSSISNLKGTAENAAVAKELRKLVATEMKLKMPAYRPDEADVSENKALKGSFTYSIVRKTWVKISVHDMHGVELEVLLEIEQTQGIYACQYELDKTKYRPGNYQIKYFENGVEKRTADLKIE